MNRYELWLLPANADPSNAVTLGIVYTTKNASLLDNANFVIRDFLIAKYMLNSPSDVSVGLWNNANGDNSVYKTTVDMRDFRTSSVRKFKAKLVAL